MNHGIFLRCHTCILDEETSEKSGKRKQDPLPRYVLVLDTETTIDTLQTLNFGVYQFCELTTEGKYRCLEEGIFHGDELGPGQQGVLRAYVTVQNKNRAEAEVKLRLYERRVFVEKVMYTAVQAGAAIVAFNLPFDLSRLITLLEAEQFPVSVKSDTKHGTVAQVFGQDIPFSIVEKLRQTRTEVKRSTYTDMETKYQPNGKLEFRAGEDKYGYRKVRDGKTKKLETLISKLVASVLREARDRAIRAEQRRLEEIEERKRAQQRFVLREQIEAEEKKVQELESWVTSWVRAQQTREFIVALEKLWKEKGHDLSANSTKGERISWMKNQADRLDPLVESPKSILDRRHELDRWY